MYFETDPRETRKEQDSHPGFVCVVSLSRWLIIRSISCILRSASVFVIPL